MKKLNIDLIKEKMAEKGLNAYRVGVVTKDDSLYSEPISTSYMSQIIKGGKDNPSMKKIVTLCQLLEVTYEQLIID